MDSNKALLTLARKNMRINPAELRPEMYCTGIVEEVAEVRAELRPRNTVRLTDELGDILWDYYTLLALCERDGLIESAEAVFAHAQRKYHERLPAMEIGSDKLWDEIKERQKHTLMKRAQEKGES